MSFIGQTAAAGINASASVTTTAMTNAANKEIAEKTNAQQYKMWQEQMQHDVDMWNMQNQYNSPEEQMKRLEQAGINPLMLDGSIPTGNAQQSAGGQTPPQFVAPTMQAPQLDFTSLSNAYKNFADARKADSESGLLEFQLDSIKELSLQGMNPEVIKTKIMLEEYNKARKENKYLPQFLDGQLKKLGREIDSLTSENKYRRELCKQVREQTRGVKLTNDFNAEQFPQQLKLLSEQILSEQQRRENEKGLAAAQINQANETAAMLSEQKGLLSQQTASESEKTMELQFRNGLRKLGINPDDKSLPFFAGVALQLYKGEISDSDVSQYFSLLAHADRVGWDKIAKSNADLTKFQLFGSQANLFGGIRQMFGEAKGMILKTPKYK